MPVPALGMSLAFELIYAGTRVPAVLYPIRIDEEKEAETTLD